jgi:hypothetical protein
MGLKSSHESESMSEFVFVGGSRVGERVPAFKQVVAGEHAQVPAPGDDPHKFENYIVGDDGLFHFDRIVYDPFIAKFVGGSQDGLLLKLDASGPAPEPPQGTEARIPLKGDAAKAEVYVYRVCKEFHFERYDAVDPPGSV